MEPDKHQLSSPLKVGLTGGIGSGKSMVSKQFAQLGVPVIDADEIARKLTTENTTIIQAIIEHFGEKVLDKKGQLDRQHLRRIIFCDMQERNWLEQCLHPLIQSSMKQKIEEISSIYCILVVPLLLEKDWQHGLVDRVLVVDTPESKQIERIQKRDAISREEVIAIMDTQLRRSTRLAHADDIIDNAGHLDTLLEQVLYFDRKYSGFS